MTDPSTERDSSDIKTPDPLYFQQASMLMLAFRFKGTRKLVASRLLIRDDFVAELIEHLPVLDRVYPDWEVSSVEIVSFQKGAFYYDEWPGAMEIVRAHQEATGRTGAEDLPDDADDRIAEVEAA